MSEITLKRLVEPVVVDRALYNSTLREHNAKNGMVLERVALADGDSTVIVCSKADLPQTLQESQPIDASLQLLLSAFPFHDDCIYWKGAEAAGGGGAGDKWGGGGGGGGGGEAMKIGGGIEEEEHSSLFDNLAFLWKQTNARPMNAYLKVHSPLTLKNQRPPCLTYSEKSQLVVFTGRGKGMEKTVNIFCPLVGDKTEDVEQMSKAIQSLNLHLDQSVLVEDPRGCVECIILAVDKSNSMSSDARFAIHNVEEEEEECKSDDENWVWEGHDDDDSDDEDEDDDDDDEDEIIVESDEAMDEGDDFGSKSKLVKSATSSSSSSKSESKSMIGITFDESMLRMQVAKDKKDFEVASKRLLKDSSWDMMKKLAAKHGPAEVLREFVRMDDPEYPMSSKLYHTVSKNFSSFCQLFLDEENGGGGGAEEDDDDPNNVLPQQFLCPITHRLKHTHLRMHTPHT